MSVTILLSQARQASLGGVDTVGSHVFNLGRNSISVVEVRYFPGIPTRR